jgi:imidazolonepropionase-like amidohydrolase
MGEHYWYSHTPVWAQPRLATFVPREVVDPAARRSTLLPEEEYNHDDVAAGARRLAERGVPVSIGAHGQREGLAAHWELWMFVQGGMTPHQALRAGTEGPARALGLDQHLGTLEPGKLADFLVFEGDVLSDIRRSVDIDLTVLGGRVLEAASLQEVWPGQAKVQPLAWALSPSDPGQDDSSGCSCGHP